MKKLLWFLARSLAPLLLSSLVPAVGWGKIAVLLSTDVGNEIDDQWAITFLLLNRAFDVKGIISAHAPNLPDPSAHTSYQVLVDVVEHRLRMSSHPPLFEGSSLALPDARTPQRNSGVDFLLKVSKGYSRKNRLVVLTIGAATDVASAILLDPTIAVRISIVAMSFQSLSEAGKEFNVQNDPHAWQAILNSKVPVTIGSGEVCKRDLSLTYEQAERLVSKRGPVGEWLWEDYRSWYFLHVAPLGEHDLSKSWVIWDIVVLAYEQGWTRQTSIPRPRLADDLSFQPDKHQGTITWITSIDSARLWAAFVVQLDTSQLGARGRGSLP